MRVISLTGYSKKEAERRKQGTKPRCYVCKRKPHDESIFYVSQNGKTEGYFKELSLSFVEIIKGRESGLVGEDTKFNFFICSDCQILMEAFLEKFYFAKIASGADNFTR